MSQVLSQQSSNRQQQQQQQQPQGFTKLNPNAFSNNNNMMTSAADVDPAIMQCSPLKNSTNNNNNNNNNDNDASMTSNTSSTVSSKKSSTSTVTTSSSANGTRKRKYTHNPYAASQTSTANSSRNSSCAPSAENSAPPTPNVNAASTSGNINSSGASSFVPPQGSHSQMMSSMPNMMMDSTNNMQDSTTTSNNSIAATTTTMMNNNNSSDFMLPPAQYNNNNSQQRQQQQGYYSGNNNNNNYNNNNNQYQQPQQQQGYYQNQQQQMMMNMYNNNGYNQYNNNNYQQQQGYSSSSSSNNSSFNSNNGSNSNLHAAMTMNHSTSSNNNNNNSNANSMMNSRNSSTNNFMPATIPHNNNNNNNNNNNILSANNDPVEQFATLRGNLVQTSCNQRGRHAVVAMIRLQQPEMFDAIFQELVPSFSVLLNDMNGCHVARTFVETLPPTRVLDFANSLQRDVVLAMCAASQHSRRVLQAMFETHNAESLQPIVDHVISGCVALATTQQGCISVMRVLEFSTTTQRDELMSVLSPHLAALAMDPYGNYVVQTITQTFTGDVVSTILEKSFAGSWLPLSCNKFASNVLEKLIRLSSGNTPTRKTLLEELVYHESNLGFIIADGYGNFVLQALIDSCMNAQEFKKMGERIRPLLASSPYGHKIEGKMKSKRFGSGSSKNSSENSTPVLTSTTPAAPIM